MQSKQKSQQQQQYDKDIDNDSQESESEYEEVCYKKENVQSMHEQVLNTWRSIESNIATTQREGSTQLTQQALELSSQIQKLLENQNKLEVQRDYEETFGRQKILELINNLELKNLKISEQNRQLINDIMSGSINVNTSSLLNGEFKLELTQEKDGAVQATQGAMGQTIGLLVTLNEIIKDEENEYEKRLEIEVQEKDQVILNLQQEMENQQKRFDKQKILTELNIIDMRKQINELEVKNFGRQINLDNLMKGKLDIEKWTDTIDQGILDAIQVLQREIRIFAKSRDHKIDTKTIMTLELFKKQLKRTSSLENLNQPNSRSSGLIDEPTPRFVLDQTAPNLMQDQRDQSNMQNNIRNLDLSSSNLSLFQANLNMNRSIYMQKQNQSINLNSKYFSSTLNSILRGRPNMSKKNGKQNYNETKESLWVYITELENQVIELSNQLKRQQDESQLDITINMSNNQAVKEIKSNLESQLEDFAIEINQKSIRIAQLEKFNQNLSRIVNDSICQEQLNKESTLVKNLRGILSPRQFKKINAFLNNNCVDQSQAMSQMIYNNVASGDQNQYMGQSMTIGQETQFKGEGTQMFRQGFVYPQFVQRGQQPQLFSQFDESKIVKNADSKNSTVSFNEHIFSNHQELDQSIQEPQVNNLISPVNKFQRYQLFGQQHFRRHGISPNQLGVPQNNNHQRQKSQGQQNQQFMLIEDQFNTSTNMMLFDDQSFDRDNHDIFSAVGGGIGIDMGGGNYLNPINNNSILEVSSIIDSSQYIKTQNNKTLNSFLNFESTQNKKQAAKVFKKQNLQINTINQDNGGSQQNSTPNNNMSILKNSIFGMMRGQNVCGGLNFSRFQQQHNNSNNNISMQAGQTGLLIQQLQDNFQTQLQDLKDEKIKLIQILNKFLNLPDDSSAQNLEQLLDTSHNLSTNTDYVTLPSKQYFEDFRLQITQALTKQQLDIQSMQQQKDQMITEREQISIEKEKLEKKRLYYNEKVEKLKAKNEEFGKKNQLMDERDNLLQQQEQKLKYRKQAMDEEWKRLDKIKDDLSKQEEAIKKEWALLKQELNELNNLRLSQKDEKIKIKEVKAKIDEERKYIDSTKECIMQEQSKILDKEKQLRMKERKVERDQERVDKARQDLVSDQQEIEKQKEFIRGERELLDQDRQDLESKRQLSGMFIPDIKNLVTKMQYKSAQRVKPSKNVNNQQKMYINDEELRIKQSNGPQNNISSHTYGSHDYKSQPHYKSNSSITNMNAYIMKCTGDQCGDHGMFNCDLHKDMNKSTINLSNISCFHQNSSQNQKSNQSFTAIGSGRNSYKNYQNQSQMINNNSTTHQTQSQSTSNLNISKNFLRNTSFKRFQQNQQNTSVQQQPTKEKKLMIRHLIPQSTKSLLDISAINDRSIDKENSQNNINTTQNKSNLDSILKGTAKFQQSRNKLEESYNSLMDSFCVPTKNDISSFQMKNQKSLNEYNNDKIKVFGMNQNIGRNGMQGGGLGHCQESQDDLMNSQYSFLSLEEEFGKVGVNDNLMIESELGRTLSRDEL
ncbi:UNKNOWN [Stylonychia lemnae]|uniref:Uncharacterized protein n=1 Tax=Stylonychia lemnae TaxID=5949 RepID=A0A078BBZ4_STYLE|nr:UNKNOWN [Stylonychia lemnae]|eukprot:CDW91731.1 UNKNOWN [Stylonychia lemnae]